jgi:hypothetical protein
MAQKMFVVRQKPKDKGNVITIHESPTASALKDIAITLNLGKPPENISPEALFVKINQRLDETLKNVPNSQKRLGNPLFNPKQPLKDEQWSKIEKINMALEQEYSLRRKMLLTRLDVTIQSFKWSETIKGKEKEINEKYGNKQQVLDKLVKGDHSTDIVALLAARDKLAIIEKTSSANVRKNTKSKLQRHIMPKVPDRGGRSLDLLKPPVEMPSWQKRQTTGNDRGRGRGNFQQNRGNFHQQQNQGYPQERYHQKAAHNPSNHQSYSGNQFPQQQQQQPQQNFSNYQDNQRDNNFRGNSRFQRGRVQSGWNPRYGGNDNNYRR